MIPKHPKYQKESVDEVDSNLLKQGETVRYTKIVNGNNKLSLDKEEVPSCWAISAVNTNEVEDYRPVNLLRICGKVLECHAN